MIKSAGFLFLFSFSIWAMELDDSSTIYALYNLVSTRGDWERPETFLSYLHQTLNFCNLRLNDKILQLKMADYFLREGNFDVDVTEGKISLVHKAVNLHAPGLLLGLLECRANPNQQGPDGRTPLHDAVQMRDDEMINLLLYHGAHTDIRDFEGFTPEHYAEQMGIWNLRNRAEHVQMIALTKSLFAATLK